MKIWKIIKGILYAALTVVIIVFAKFWAEEVRYLVGGLMFIYGIPEIIIFAIKTRSFKEHTQFFWAIIEVLLGVITMFVVKDYESICVTWAIWSILREAYEIEESVHELVHHKPGILSIIESIVIIYFSVTLLMEPGEHHAMIHCYYILPLELLTSGIVWPLLELLYEKVIHKNLIKEHESEENE